LKRGRVVAVARWLRRFRRVVPLGGRGEEAGVRTFPLKRCVLAVARWLLRCR